MDIVAENGKLLLRFERLLFGKWRFNCVVVPVTLKIVFGRLDIYNIIFYLAMFMSGNNIMKPLLGRNAECKKQKHYAGVDLPYRIISVQFFVTGLQIIAFPRY